jgi:hypothetical protein
MTSISCYLRTYHHIISQFQSKLHPAWLVESRKNCIELGDTPTLVMPCGGKKCHREPSLLVLKACEWVSSVGAAAAKVNEGYLVSTSRVLYSTRGSVAISSCAKAPPFPLASAVAIGHSCWSASCFRVYGQQSVQEGLTVVLVGWLVGTPQVQWQMAIFVMQLSRPVL